MKREIFENTDGLKIEISNVKGKEAQLLEAFQECAEGRCSCPTQEYTKLEELQVEQDEQKITLRLIAKDGQQFNQTEIKRCLDYTEDHVKGNE